MQFLRDLSIRGKLFGGFGIVLILCAVVGVTSISSLSSVDQAGAGIYANNVVSLQQLGRASTAFTDEQRLVLRGLVYAHDRAIQQQVSAGVVADQATVQKQLSHYTGAGLAPQETAAMATLGARRVHLFDAERPRAVADRGRPGGRCQHGEPAGGRRV